MAKRVYFAFHYQDVIDFRANVVRKHNFIGGVKAAGYYDHSIWEEARNTNPLALKRLINSELKGTSVTAVLIGSQTWGRRWVRYEIFKSIEQGNSILGIHINSIAGKDTKTKLLGPNPFENLGLQISKDGTKATPAKWNNTQWCYYLDLGAFSVPKQPIPIRGKNIPLTHWFGVYDWVANNGYKNFDSWIT